MKNISAKLKLTLWTTLLMAIMASVTMALIFSFSGDIIATNSKDIITKVVSDNADELEFDDGKLEIDDIDFFDNSVYTLIYTENGEHIAGNLPEEFASTPQFKDKQISQITVDDTLYYIYDELSPVEDYHSLLWVRGVIAVDEVASAVNSILQIAMFTLPLFILFGAVGCYFIAKNTFKPLDKIIKTAQKISESENLALRINLQQGSTEMQNLASAFDKMFERLESAFEAEKQFASDVSHELRTPTAVILAQCEYAIGENITHEDKQEALETVQRQAFKMSKLITNLLKLIRYDRGIEKANLKNINFSELISEICEEHELIAPENIKLNYNITPNICGTFDDAMITRLTTNLISNAFRYCKANGNVDVELSENISEIILKVKDDGIGISEENQRKIWNRFYQVDASRTNSQNTSMGLGLAMVAQIAKLHHAKIELESEIDKGSIFIVKFPK